MGQCNLPNIAGRVSKDIVVWNELRRQSIGPRTVQRPGHNRMSEQTDKYRRNAEEARQQAEKCVSVVDKESWLNIEKGWLQLAHEAERKF